MAHGQQTDQELESTSGCSSTPSSFVTLCSKAKNSMLIEPEEKVHGLSGAPLDGDGEGKTLVSLKAQQCGQNDPECASECVARVKEVQLKAKLRAAHLRARLAAEKSLLEG
jgi:hypothetical protein